MKQINSLATRLSLIVGLFFLCADFLSIVKGDADVVRSVDRQLVDESVEGVRGEFRQSFRRAFECFEEILVADFPGLSFHKLLAELVNSGLELVIPIGKVIIASLVNALVESRVGVLLDVLLECIDHEPVAIGFEFVGFEEEQKHLFAICDDLGFCFEQFIHRRQERGFYLAVVYGGCRAFLAAIILVVAALLHLALE